MAISTNGKQLERDKFVEQGTGITAIRVKPVAATVGAGIGLKGVKDNEKNKFIEDAAGDVAMIIKG
jgi:hypothetical protein